MNDDELMTAVRDSVAGLHLDVPEDRITRRARSIRTRRRIPVVAGAVAVVAAASVAVPASLSAGPQSAKLAAFTVHKQPSGLIDLTIRQLFDAEALQRELRADGVRAVVLETGSAGTRSCPVLTPNRVNQVFRIEPQRASGVLAHATINPGAIPSGASLAIIEFGPATPQNGKTQKGKLPPGPSSVPTAQVQPGAAVSFELVHTSPACSAS